MVSKIFLLGCLVLSFNSTGQNESLNVPGTHIFIDPPVGFELSENFTGLEKDEYSAVQINDLPDGNFYSNMRNFNRQNFAAQGIEVVKLTDSIIDGYDAKVSIMIDPNGTSKLLQVGFGDSTFSAMIIGFVPADDAEAANAMWKSITAVKYDKDLIFDPLETAGFTFDESQSKFKFAKSNTNNYIFSLDGVILDKYIDVPFISVSTMPSSPKLSPKSVSLNFAQGFRNEGYTLSLESDSFAKINGHRAYEVVYSATSPEGEHSKMYSLVLKNEKHIINVLAKLNTDFDTLIEECKKLCKTIQIK